MPDFDRSDTDCDAFLARRLSHYHIIRLNDRIRTPGVVDRNAEFAYLGLGPDALRSRRVLDVGALDGVLSFNAERAGAAEVVAIDVEDPVRYDWGWDGPPKAMTTIGEVKRRTFDELQVFFDSRVMRRQATVYDVSPERDGLFDVIFFYGVLYHLRHPLLAFDRLRAVCRGALCVETHVCNHDPLTPASLFYRDDVLAGAITNWTGPSEACVASWMRDAGFATIYAERKPRVLTRQRFVGFVDAPTFPVDADNFKALDAGYFAKVRAACEARLAEGARWRG